MVDVLDNCEDMEVCEVVRWREKLYAGGRKTPCRDGDCSITVDVRES